MTIKEMHYDFKQKLNKIDSQKYRNLKVPEIDWKLNEAQEVFVKIIAQPHLAGKFGFETSQRSIDDIRTIVKDQKHGAGITPTKFDDYSFIATLPPDYWFYANSKAYCSKSTCSNIKILTKEISHDDEAEESPFDRSSFEWRQVNIRFNNEGIRLFTDGTFSVDELVLSYLIEPEMMYNAADWIGGTYNLLDGTVLTGTQDCQLPPKVHREIVDLAVLITANDLNLPIQSKQYKVSLTK